MKKSIAMIEVLMIKNTNWLTIKSLRIQENQLLQMNLFFGYKRKKGNEDWIWFLDKPRKVDGESRGYFPLGRYKLPMQKNIFITLD